MLYGSCHRESLGTSRLVAMSFLRRLIEEYLSEIKFGSYDEYVQHSDHPVPGMLH